MTINVNEICDGLPGITPISGKHLFEACVVCLTRQNHSFEGTKLAVSFDKQFEMTMTWDNIFNEQLDRTWKDQEYTTEHGAVCLAILTALKLTDFTVIERAVKKTGIDYWLGKKGDLLFQIKARLEISGIFNGSENEIYCRYNFKIKQTKQSDKSQLPAFIGIVEFNKPFIKFGEKI